MIETYDRYFSQRNARVTKLCSHDPPDNFFGDIMEKIYDVITFISKYLYFRKA